MLFLLLQLPPAGPAAPGRSGCRATPTCPCGCGLPEALLCPLRGHLQGKFIKVSLALAGNHKPVNKGNTPTVFKMVSQSVIAALYHHD